MHAKVDVLGTLGSGDPLFIQVSYEILRFSKIHEKRVRVNRYFILNCEYALTLSFQVDFDKTKHLSEKNIRRRRIEREKLEKLEMERLERARREKEEEQRKIEEERFEISIKII